MAVAEIGWATIAPGGSLQWFVHGFSARHYVSFSIVVFPGTGSAFFPKADATLTQGRSLQHVDGTKAYLVTIRNNASFNSCNVKLLSHFESQ